MAALSQAQLHSFTDLIAAMIKKDLDGFETELQSRTIKSLWDLLDATGDPDMETALGARSLAVDMASLPENHHASVAAIVSRAAYGDYVSALNSYVSIAAGGSYAGIRAALADKSAVVHPLFAEAVRRRLGEAALTNSDADVTTVFAPTYGSIAPALVYTGADGALVDDTTDAVDVGTADIALFGTNGHSLYVGSRRKFSQIVVGLSTLANVTIQPTFQYWDGGAWRTLTVTDNATGFTKNDTIKFTPPADWGRGYVDAGGNEFSDKARLYWVRITRAASSLATPPVGTCIRLVPAAVLTNGLSGQHLGVDQPPLAICRVTAANTITVESIVTLAYQRFREPGLYLRALTPFGATLTPTVAYVDQAGSAGNTQAQGGWASPAALDEVAVTLAGGDTGARSIETSGWAVTVSGSGLGVFEVIVKEARVPAV